MKKQKQNTIFYTYTRFRIINIYACIQITYKYVFAKKKTIDNKSFYEQTERQDDDGLCKGNIKIEVTNFCWKYI